MQPYLNSQEGFTLLEMVVIVPIMTLTVIVLLAMSFSLFGHYSDRQMELNAGIELQAASFVIQDDMVSAMRFLTVPTSTSQQTMQDPYAPGGGWNAGSAVTPTLIVQIPAKTASFKDPNRKQVYINKFGCTPFVTQAVMETNERAYMNVVYFLKDATFYRRILTVPSATAQCNTNYLTQTCPEANSSAACPADKVLVQNVSSMSVQYMAPNNSATSTPENADKVTITIKQLIKHADYDTEQTKQYTYKRLAE